LAPRDDVDLLALEFLHHRLHAAALHADAGADRVDAGIAADDADLGAAAGIARGGLDLDDAVVDLRHFLREQLAHEIGVRAGEEELRPAVVALHLQHQRADTLAHAGGLARELLVAADDALGAAEVDDHVAEFDRLDDAGDDLARAVLEFLELPFALRIADLREAHLLGALRVDTAEIDRRQRIDDEIADRRARLELFGLLGIDLLEVVLDLLDHFDHAPQAQIAGHRIELGP